MGGKIILSGLEGGWGLRVWLDLVDMLGLVVMLSLGVVIEEC